MHQLSSETSSAFLGSWSSSARPRGCLLGPSLGGEAFRLAVKGQHGHSVSKTTLGAPRDDGAIQDERVP